MEEDIIKELGDRNLELIGNKNHALPGNNGPYNDKDIPVRNTAHWLITYIYLYKKYKDKKYLNIVNKFSEYLMQDELYGCDGIIKIRNNRDTDYTNGLIGEAWVIEALIAAAFFFNDDKYYEKALKIFEAEPFDEKIKLWKIKDLDGTCNTIDYVYNHQLWFAAAGSKIIDYKYNSTIDKHIRAFLNNYKNNLGIQPSGMLFHQVNYQYTYKAKLSLIVKCILCDLGIGKRWKAQKELEEGYETFDFYGFALLYNKYKECKIFQSSRFKRALNYCLNKDRVKKLYIENNYINKYAYPYNSPAFEYQFISMTFRGYIDENLNNELLNNQIKITYSSNGILQNNNNDALTLTARIYELTRYYDILNNKGGI